MDNMSMRNLNYDVGTGNARLTSITQFTGNLTIQSMKISQEPRTRQRP